VKWRTEGSRKTQLLCLATAIPAIILSGASIALYIGAKLTFMTVVSAFSTAAAAVVGVFVLPVARASLNTKPEKSGTQYEFPWCMDALAAIEYCVPVFGGSQS
jgi:hypothetical protein